MIFFAFLFSRQREICFFLSQSSELCDHEENAKKNSQSFLKLHNTVHWIEKLPFVTKCFDQQNLLITPIFSNINCDRLVCGLRILVWRWGLNPYLFSQGMSLQAERATTIPPIYTLVGWNGDCDFGLQQPALTEEVRVKTPSL